LFGIALTMPFHSVAVVVLRTVLAPLLIGMLVHRLAPPLAERMARPTGIVASVILILGLLVVLIASARTIISLIGNGTLFALVIFASVGLLVGYAFARSQPDKRVVLALATCSRHPGVAAAIAVMNFPNQKLALPAVALYLIVSAILSGIASARWKNVGVSPSKFKKSMAA
jgi:BASS family bile acid:Na+ symporter